MTPEKVNIDHKRVCVCVHVCMCVCKCVCKDWNVYLEQDQNELQTDINLDDASCVVTYNNLLIYMVTSNFTYDHYNVIRTIHLYSYIHQVMNRFHYSDRQGCRWLCKKYNK